MNHLLMSTKRKMQKIYAELSPKIIQSVIRDEGYFPHIETDGDVSFKIESTTFTFGTCARGFVYGRIYYHLKREEYFPALLAAQQVELSCVAIKTLVIPENKSLIFSVESLCGSIETFRLFFTRALPILTDSVGTFINKLNEFKSNKEYYSELEDISRRQTAISHNSSS